MKFKLNQVCLLPLLALCVGDLTAQAADAPKATATPDIQAASMEVALTVPQSQFVIPASPKEGRNPFFPRSKSELPVSKEKPETLESFPIILNGITSPPKRTAMINGRTFETGESGDVKLQNGAKVSIECVEIRNDAAIIKVGAQRRELRLRTGI